MNARRKKEDKLLKCDKSLKISNNFQSQIAIIKEDPRESDVNLQEKENKMPIILRTEEVKYKKFVILLKF